MGDLRASQRYYRDALGFKLDWDHGEPADFASVSRSESRREAIIKMPPTNMPWGLREM